MNLVDRYVLEVRRHLPSDIRDDVSREIGSSIDDAIDAIEDAETESSYRGNWYHVFDGGCVVYAFDAKGASVDTLEDDIELALGLFDAEALKQTARDAGYNLP